MMTSCDHAHTRATHIRELFEPFTLFVNDRPIGTFLTIEAAQQAAVFYMAGQPTLRIEERNYPVVYPSGGQ